MMQNLPKQVDDGHSQPKGLIIGMSHVTPHCDSYRKTRMTTMNTPGAGAHILAYFGRTKHPTKPQGGFPKPLTEKKAATWSDRSGQMKKTALAHGAGIVSRETIEKRLTRRRRGPKNTWTCRHQFWLFLFHPSLASSPHYGSMILNP